MDYDAIVKGRRRNWDALKPDEVRQREKEEERTRRQEELDKSPNRGATGFQRWRARLLERAREEDQRRFQLALRQSLMMAGIFAVCFVGWIAVERIVAQQARALFSKRANDYEAALTDKQAIFTLEDPLGAFSTWRSAWIREDYPMLVKTFSNNYLGRVQPNKDQSALVKEYRKMAENGGMESSIAVAINFGDPDPVRLPSRPWLDGDLAIFRSQPIIIYGEEKSYTAAISFDGKSGTWRFADMRESQYFSVRWKKEDQIPPFQAGSGAARYNDEGYELE
ncbi:hypothetical protein GC173_10640 [bacterium]|nr:hypothetical protein [bacterium]